MVVTRKFLIHRIGIAAAILVLAGATAFAQEAEVEAKEVSEETEESVEAIEEITVIAEKPGDRRRVDEEYEDPVKAQLLKDFYEMKADQEEYEWRKAAAEDDSSRIKWGYDPADEYRMRNELNLDDLPSERTKPATLFKVTF
jgi:hypothetical protein